MHILIDLVYADGHTSLFRLVTIDKLPQIDDVVYCGRYSFLVTAVRLPIKYQLPQHPIVNLRCLDDSCAPLGIYQLSTTPTTAAN